MERYDPDWKYIILTVEIRSLNLKYTIIERKVRLKSYDPWRFCQKNFSKWSYTFRESSFILYLYFIPWGSYTLIKDRMLLVKIVYLRTISVMQLVDPLFCCLKMNRRALGFSFDYPGFILTVYFWWIQNFNLPWLIQVQF